MANNSGIEVARAFVTITPSMEGAQKEMTKELVPAAEKAGDEAGQKTGSKLVSGIGKILKTGAKTIGVGIAAITTTAVAGITAIVKESVQNFADYEQLVGGVEKIFDEMDPSAILNDAHDAWKNLNMSANEYLEAVNSVGASFSATMGDKAGYETAKKGMQAIADFASGTGRSVTELNEKYKAITRSAGSYQSIADQFSGILPATSASFLKQAQAAGYLKKSYKKLTDVPIAEYQAAVTAMLEKGVDQLGLTGNTANETLNTISGSIAGTKSAWSNLVVAFASGEDITKRLNDLKTAIFGVKGEANGLLNNVMPIIGEVIGNLGSVVEQVMPAIEELMPQVTTAITDILHVLIRTLPSAIKTLAQAIRTMLPGLMKSIVQMIKELIPTLASLATDLIEIIGVFVVEIINALPDIIQSIVDALPTMIPVIIDAVVDIVLAIIDKIDDIIKPIIEALPEIIKSLVSALINAAPQLIQGITTLITELIKMLPEILPELIQLGFDVFFMIVENIDSIIGPLLDALPTILTTIFDAILELVPQLIELLVKNVPKFIKGLIKVQVAIIKKLPEVLQEIWNAITKFFSTVWDEWIGPAIQKVDEFFGTIAETFTGIWKEIKKTAIEIVKWFLHTIAEPIALAFATAWDSISYGAKVLWWGVKTVFATGINTIIDLLNGAIDFINTIGRSVANVLGTTYEEIKPIGKIVTESFDEIGENSHQAAEDVKKSFAGLDQWLDEQVAEPSKEAFKNALSSKTGIGKTITDSTNAWKTALGTVAEKAKKMPEDVSAPANSSLNDLLKKTKQTMNDINAATGKKINHPTVEKPHFTVSPKGWKYADLLKGVVPKFGIEWYAKAMEKGMILNGATIFGAIGNKLLGGGEAGSETVVGTNSLMQMIETAVNKASGAINRLGSLQSTRAVNNNQNIVVNVYGAEGQSVDDLADVVIDRLQDQIYTQEAVFA